MEKTLIIIDGNSLINRAYYAMQRPMITGDGFYTQGIYGFINMLAKIREDYAPEYITVAFDLKAPTFRHKEYAEYKAGRKPMPPELAMEMPVLKDVLHAMNIKTVELEGYEADDLIGTVSRVGEEMGLEPVIVTGDKDALQLASDITKVVITKRGVTDFEIYDYDKMLERYNMTPSQFIDLKGIMGDSSDNIPGIPGIGEKGGIELLTQFGSIENMLLHTDEIRKKGMRAKVEEHAQLAVMSKRLATINRNVPMDFEMEDFRVKTPDYDKLIELYTRLEFNSFLKRLHIDQPAENTEVKTSSEIQKLKIRTSSELDKLSAFRNADTYIKVYSDYSHIDPPNITGIVLMDKSAVAYIDMQGVTVSDAIGVLDSLNLKLYGHDIKNDIFCLMLQGFSNFEIVFDTAVAQYVLDPSRSNYDLQALALEVLHKTLPDESEIFGQSGQLDMFSDASEDYLNYGLISGTLVSELKQVQELRVKKEALENVLYDVELPLIEVLASMEADGICCDRIFIDDFGRELKAEISRIEKEIYSLAGMEFNIKSTRQLGELLFDKLGLPSGKKTKSGYSTAQGVLEKIRSQHPIIDLILAYRNLTKLDSTYIEGMKPLIGGDSKVHAHFMQTVTTTGRISCTEPNLQNIPVRQELGRKLRKAFTASEDHTLIGADYSQIELRVLAHLSEDEGLIDAFNKGEDIHKRTASRVLGIPYDEVTSTDRSRAKAVNFGVIYGMSGFGLSEEISVSRKEAEEYINDYYFQHPMVRKYMDERIALARETGYSLTIMGRKRKIPEINASKYMVKQLGERLAMNSPVQGSAADIIKLAMIKVYNELKEKHPDSHLILQVHDELIIDCSNSEIEEVSELLRRNMESAMELKVKLLAEVNTAECWYDLK